MKVTPSIIAAQLYGSVLKPAQKAPAGAQPGPDRMAARAEAAADRVELSNEAQQFAGLALKRADPSSVVARPAAAPPAEETPPPRLSGYGPREAPLAGERTPPPRPGSQVNIVV
jgi:hypothetical protein